MRNERGVKKVHFAPAGGPGSKLRTADYQQTSPIAKPAIQLRRSAMLVARRIQNVIQPRRGGMPQPIIFGDKCWVLVSYLCRSYGACLFTLDFSTNMSLLCSLLDPMASLSLFRSKPAVGNFLTSEGGLFEDGIL